MSIVFNGFYDILIFEEVSRVVGLRGARLTFATKEECPSPKPAGLTEFRVVGIQGCQKYFISLKFPAHEHRSYRRMRS